MQCKLMFLMLFYVYTQTSHINTCTSIGRKYLNILVIQITWIKLIMMYYNSLE